MVVFKSPLSIIFLLLDAFLTPAVFVRPATDADVDGLRAEEDIRKVSC
jgi:hypothetical protein